MNLHRRGQADRSPVRYLDLETPLGDISDGQDGQPGSGILAPEQNHGGQLGVAVVEGELDARPGGYVLGGRGDDTDPAIQGHGVGCRAGLGDGPEQTAPGIGEDKQDEDHDRDENQKSRDCEYGCVPFHWIVLLDI